MQYDAIIFDIDGTLWNCEEACAEGWNRALESLGYIDRVTPSDISTVTGRPYEECIQVLLPHVYDEVEDVVGKFNPHEKEAVLEKGGVLYDHVHRGLSRLAEDYEIGLVSNCQDWYLDNFISFAGIGDFLVDADCHGKSGLSKGRMIQGMIERNGFGRSVYVGDTAGDEKGADDAGVDFIHASYGFGKPVGKHKTVSSFRELVELFIP
jgi:phosphoglycolate phosphatase